MVEPPGFLGINAGGSTSRGIITHETIEKDVLPVAHMLWNGVEKVIMINVIGQGCKRQERVASESRASNETQGKVVNARTKRTRRRSVEGRSGEGGKKNSPVGKSRGGTESKPSESYGDGVDWGEDVQTKGNGAYRVLKEC